MGPFCLNYLRRLNPTLFQADSQAGEKTANLDKFVMEQVFDFLKQAHSPEGIVKTIFFPEWVQEVKFTSGKAHFKQTPIFLENAARYILFLFWDQSMFDELFLRQTFEVEGKDDAEKKGIFCVSLLNTINQESIPVGISSYPQLFEACNRVKLTNAAVRQVIASPPMVLEAMPGVHANQFVFAGQNETGFIETQAKKKMELFYLGVFLEILLAVLAALSGALYFMTPLRELFGALKKIEQGKYDIRLDSSRPDEFGSLASAFNNMAEKLQQGEILGNYVSAPVKRAIRDPKFKAVATEGKIGRFTILFSCLFRFDEFQKSNKPYEVFQVMEKHFNAVQSATAKFGGEIDKVIGDKILVFFDHTEFAGGKAAARAALDVIQETRKILKETCPLEPVMGLNSGSAIAGFIGAQNILQEYTVIGDTVNLASRLATLGQITGGTRVVISNATRGLLGLDIPMERLPFKYVKGKTRQVTAFLLKESPDLQKA